MSPSRTCFAFAFGALAIFPLCVFKLRTAVGVPGASPKGPLLHASSGHVQAHSCAPGGSRSIGTEPALPGRLPHRLDHRARSLARIADSPRRRNVYRLGASSRSGLALDRGMAESQAWEGVLRLVRREREFAAAGVADLRGNLAAQTCAIGTSSQPAPGQTARGLNVIEFPARDAPQRKAA